MRVFFNTDKRGQNGHLLGLGVLSRDPALGGERGGGGSLSLFPASVLSGIFSKSYSGLNVWGRELGIVALRMERHPWWIVTEDNMVREVRLILLNLSAWGHTEPCYPAVRYYEREEKKSDLLWEISTFRSFDQDYAGYWYDISWVE